MITPNENDYYEVDLSKVTRVRIGNQWTDIRPGSLVVGRAKLLMPGGRVILPGGLSYFFLDTGGHLHSGPYEHIQEMQAPRPETNENEGDYQA